jgi:type IV pilus assembly protein PilB
LSSTTSGFRSKLEQYFLDNQLMTAGEIDALTLTSQQTGLPLEQLLISNGIINQATLVEIWGGILNTKVISLKEVPYNDMALLELLPDDLMEEKRLLPVSNNNGRLCIAMVDPLDRTTINEITFLTGVRPQVLACLEMEFREWWSKYESMQVIKARGSIEKQQELNFSLQAASEEKKERDASTTVGVNLDDIKQKAEAELQDNANPLVKFVNSLIIQAIDMGASDLHVEPRVGKYEVRFRMDGVLKRIVEIPEAMENAIMTRLKVMAKLDIADKRRPQDGRMQMTYKHTDYNIRVSTLPVTDGREKMVMRILRPAKHITDFKKLGFSDQDVTNIEYLYKAPYGIVLVCGPTGSGKSTTLYTILNKINDEIINVSTVEDPVELKLEGINQSQVNPKADFTFASSMRALLRQDPDVIMVGEIRDYETLEAGIHAALTGHLVFSTIHANSSATTITRMLEMGASASLISAALNGVIAQRLIRSLCAQCKAPYQASDLEKLKLFTKEPHRLEEPLTLYKAVGCSMCKDSGYSGRQGLYEIMMVNRELRHLISAQASDLEIEDASIENGMTSLIECAKSKIVAGVADFVEVERVLGLIIVDTATPEQLE